MNAYALFREKQKYKYSNYMLNMFRDYLKWAEENFKNLFWSTSEKLSEELSEYN